MDQASTPVRELDTDLSQTISSNPGVSQPLDDSLKFCIFLLLKNNFPHNQHNLTNKNLT